MENMQDIINVGLEKIFLEARKELDLILIEKRKKKEIAFIEKVFRERKDCKEKGSCKFEDAGEGLYVCSVCKEMEVSFSKEKPASAQGFTNF